MSSRSLLFEVEGVADAESEDSEGSDRSRESGARREVAEGRGRDTFSDESLDEESSFVSLTDEDESVDEGSIDEDSDSIDDDDGSVDDNEEDDDSVDDDSVDDSSDDSIEADVDEDVVVVDVVVVVVVDDDVNRDGFFLNSTEGGICSGDVK